MTRTKLEPNSPAIASTQYLSSGQLWQSRYQIVKPLGNGGFGKTYLAIDTHHPSQQSCVIKQLKPYTESGLLNSAETERRFYREVEALRHLGHHDRIPQLLDQVEENGERYLIQEFIAGRSLEQELPSNTNSPRWSEAQVIDLLQDVLQILAFVHQQGMIHRDIKPGNLIRRQHDSRFALIDFGAITCLLSSSELVSDHPHVTMAIHSEGYTPIEQLRGKPCPASDFYALGMVAIQALTGLHPREFEETLALTDITWSHSTPVSAGLIAVLVTMTRRRWSDRYQTAERILQDLQDLVDCSSLDVEVSNDDSIAIEANGTEYTPTQIAAPPQSEPVIAPPVFSPPLSSPSYSSKNSKPHKERVNPPEDSNPSKRVEWRELKKRWKRVFTARVCSLLVGVALISTGASLFLWIIAGWQFEAERSSIVASPSPAKFLLNTLIGKTTVRSITFDVDGQTVIGGLSDSTTARWDITLPQPIQTFATHFNSITTVAVSPNGQHLATGSDDTNITLWDLQTGELLHTLRGHRWPILSVTFSPDAQTLVSSGSDHTVRVWDVESGQQLHTLNNFQDSFLSMDISENGSLLVGGGANNTITVWNGYTYEVVRTLRGHTDAVNTIAITPNGTTLVSGSADHTVKIWNLYTGELLNTLTGHRDAVNAVAVSPNGRTLVSGSADRTIKVWDLYTGTLIYTFKNQTHSILSVAINPDGTTLATTGTDGTVNVWQMPNVE
jgi:serine/threonine protein kinase